MPRSIYSYHDCNLGQVLIVTSNVGVKTIELADSRDSLNSFAGELDSLGYPNATAQHASDNHASDNHASANHASDWHASVQHQRWCDQALDLINGAPTFDSPPIDPDGTDFQRSVWNQLQLIGVGQTQTYQQIAKAIGRPTACRAVASAIGANPIAVLIPCHRVIRKDGTLSGFRWGVQRKQALLEREGWSMNANGSRSGQENHDRALVSPAAVS